MYKEYYLVHHGIMGQKWGVRRYQNYDGTLIHPKRDYINKRQQILKDSSVSSKERYKLLKNNDEEYKKKLADNEKRSKEEYEKTGREKTKKALMIVGGITLASLATYAVYQVGKNTNLLNKTTKITPSITPEDLKMFFGRDTTAKLFTNAYEANKYNTEHLFDKHAFERLSWHEQVGIKAYTSSHYLNINKLLRFGQKPYTTDLATIENYIKGATSALEKSPLKEDVIAHRGIGNSLHNMLGVDKSMLSDSNFLDSLIGTQFVDKGFVSAGGSVEDAWGGVKLHILCPKGTKAMYVDPISAFKGEHELLIQRNSTFAITNFVKGEDGNIKELFVEVIKQQL